MAVQIQAIFINPPIAVARLEGSDTPMDSVRWVDSPDPHLQTVIAPDWSLDVDLDGVVTPRMPESLTFRDGLLIRPGAPFFELWALLGEPGSNANTWKSTQLTPGVLKEAGFSIRLAIRTFLRSRDPKQMDDVDLTILGGGPAGLFLGIAAASLLRSRVHIWTRQSYRDSGKTLEAVPASLLVLLRQFGISPSDIGVSQVYRTREVGWSSIVPSLVSSAPFALIERPRFDRVLLRRLLRFTGVEVREAVGGEFEDPTLCGDLGRVLVDATGRRAYTSSGVAPRFC
jgi:hypothetical protein